MVIWQAARAADEHRITQKPNDDRGYRGFEEPQNCFHALSGSELGVQMLRLLLDAQGRDWVPLCGGSDCICHEERGSDP